MPTRERPADRGRLVARRAALRLADDLRSARISAGLSQREIAAALGVSHPQIGRFERQTGRSRWLEFVSGYGAVVGLEISLRTYPSGDPVRDRAQLAPLERLRSRLHPDLVWRTEVPLPIATDLRAWDAVISPSGRPVWRVCVEAETRIADGQALERRISLKMRDDPGGRVILLVSDTRANRAAIRSLGQGLVGLFPVEARYVLRALREGREPEANGIVIL
jgi:transcriptional regulator with XRE-family HTH domain